MQFNIQEKQSRVNKLYCFLIDNTNISVEHFEEVLREISVLTSKLKNACSSYK